MFRIVYKFFIYELGISSLFIIVLMGFYDKVDTYNIDYIGAAIVYAIFIIFKEKRKDFRNIQLISPKKSYFPLRISLIFSISYLFLFVSIELIMSKEFLFFDLYQSSIISILIFMFTLERFYNLMRNLKKTVTHNSVGKRMFRKKRLKSPISFIKGKLEQLITYFHAKNSIFETFIFMGYLITGISCFLNKTNPIFLFAWVILEYYLRKYWYKEIILEFIKPFIHLPVELIFTEDKLIILKHLKVKSVIVALLTTFWIII